MCITADVLIGQKGTSLLHKRQTVVIRKVMMVMMMMTMMMMVMTLLPHRLTENKKRTDFLFDGAESVFCLTE